MGDCAGVSNEVPQQFRAEVDALYRWYRYGEPRKLYVAKTTLIGCSFHGLFAGVSFKKNDVVCIYAGSILHTQDAIRLQDKSYLMRLGEQQYIDAKNHPDIMARFMNDCIVREGYNVTFDKRLDMHCAQVIALRDIDPGEELFVDYGKWYWAGKKPTGLLRLSDQLLTQHRNAFALKLLEMNRGNVSQRMLLQSQTLTIAFCVKYILSSHCIENDGNCAQSAGAITIGEILHYQPHIAMKDLTSFYSAFCENRDKNRMIDEL
jgi:hypothetical protein